MAERTCAVGDCPEIKIQARDWCARHYFRWIKSGKVSPIPPPKMVKSCSIEGCANKYRCSGYCGYHYMRWFETGSPEPPAPKPAECSVDGCELAPRSRGMCRKHYERVIRTGTTDEPVPRRRATGCLVDGCACPRYAAFGYCAMHYRRLCLYGSPTGKPQIRSFPCEVDGCAAVRRRGPGLCKRHMRRDYYHRHLEAMRERDRRRRSGDGALRRSALRRALYWADPEKHRAAARAWHAANKDATRRAKQRYRQRYPDKVRVRNQRRRARLRNAPINDLTAGQWREIKAAYRFCCAYCHRRARLTMDHVLAIARNGPNTASNVVPACGSCNSKKGVKDPPTYQPLLF